MKLVIAADHAGFALKELLKGDPILSSHDVTDLGTHDLESVDYPDFAQKLAHTILDGTANMGVLICGTGIGMSMAANRFKGIRAALCHDVTTAKLTRLHNNANILCLGARVIGTTTALDITEAFLHTSFEGGKHLVRTQKMDLDH
jgi:ribose 5-phosphate isomerase B